MESPEDVVRSQEQDLNHSTWWEEISKEDCYLAIRGCRELSLQTEGRVYELISHL